MREFFPDPATCPVGNICQFNGAPEVACGSVPEHVPQLAFAEDLCFYGLVSHLDSLEPSEFYGEQIEMASAIIEIGINTSDDNLAKTCFSVAKEHLMKIKGDTKIGSDKWIIATKELVYLPALEARRFSIFNLETIQNTYSDLGAMGGEILKCTTVTEGNLKGVLGETVIPGLLMRLQEIKYFPYGTTSREGYGLHNLEYNHDAYLRRSYGKLPIEIKYGVIRKRRAGYGEEPVPEYDASILKISYHAVAGATIQKFQELIRARAASPAIDRELVQMLLAHTLVLEASGEELDDSQLLLLNCASKVIKQKILDHERKMRSKRR